MNTSAEDRKAKNYILMRSIMDYGMGGLIFCFGIFLAIAPRLGFSFAIDPLFRYIFSGMCVLYGGWRMYRGYKKNYFSE
jgi:hypothetical protein